MIKMLSSLDLSQWYSLLGIAALLCAGALFFYRKVVRPSVRFVWIRAIRVYGMAASIELIKNEVFTNGGKSLRDTVENTSRMITDVAKDVSMSIAQNRSLAEEMTIGMFECDPEGALLWANRALRQVTGLRMEEIRGSGWFNAVHDDDRRRVQTDWMLATASRSQFLALFRFTHVGTGTSLAVRCEAQPIFADGSVTVGGIAAGWLGLVRLRQGEAV